MIPLYLVEGSRPFLLEYLVIGGGGGGGGITVAGADGGGGGAGGYICSVPGETSGANSSAADIQYFIGGTSITVTVGAGGPHSTNGNNSVLGPVVAIGGGRGGIGATSDIPGGDGGAGGGGGATTLGGSGTALQGLDGKQGGFIGGTNYPADYVSGGGGGAAQDGDDRGVGYGGNGLASSITGTSVTRAGGGGGSIGGSLAVDPNKVTRTGGAGGGGRGSRNNFQAGLPAVDGTPGEVNTGSGGGGGHQIQTSSQGQPGGSGFVVLRYDNRARVIRSIDPGLTYTYANTGTQHRYIFTAGSGNIVF